MSTCVIYISAEKCPTNGLKLYTTFLNVLKETKIPSRYQVHVKKWNFILKFKKIQFAVSLVQAHILGKMV